MAEPVLFIDPGLDELGAAVFDRELFQERRRIDRPETVAAARALLHRSLFRNPVRRGDVPHRLARIAGAAEDLVLEWRPVDVYIEIPTFAGQYKRHEGNILEKVALLWEAIGAIHVGVDAGLNGAGGIHRVRATSLPKDERHDVIRTALRRAEQEDEERADVLDAIWLGVYVLSTRAQVGA